MGGDGRQNSSIACQVLADRCRSLEEQQTKLRDQFDELLLHQNNNKPNFTARDHADSSSTTASFLSGFFFSQTPYASVLKCMGHAVHVHSVSSGEIVYWNHSAETLYGWKDYEIIGKRVTKFLITEEYYAPLQKILERLITTGETWSGKFPYKKKCGEVFMVMVTKAPLYEDGVLVGVISVSSEAAKFNTIDSEFQRTCQSGASGQPGVQKLNSKGNQWPLRPLIAPMPQIASSVSNLASKILPNRHMDDTVSRNTSTDANDEKLEKCSIYETKLHSRHHHKEQNATIREASEKDESTTEFGRASKIAARFMAKLQIGGTGKWGKDTQSVKTNCRVDNPESDGVNNGNHSSGGSAALTSHQDVANGVDREENLHKCDSLFSMKTAHTNVYARRTSSVFEVSSAKPFSRECYECLGSLVPQDPLLRLHRQFDPKKLEPEATHMAIEDEVQKQQGRLQLPSSRESVGSHESSSSKGDNDSVVDCEIHWEDLHLRDEIGQGSYAVVYHGIWNGSDVAIKVYFGNGYTEETLQDYKKEIDIMKRLRHPNVLLFMGAVYSLERLAIVTELLPRGSLFKTLHKSNQTLDIRRRLRMALDIARGMNYLHHRNPPIVHRDLKSSNLLVDKNWTVKVGDFGLSRLKDTTLLTTKSGRGTSLRCSLLLTSLFCC
ncbi:uncharacterized protein LOC130741153 isoform X2 [Lotus japonicus]|uniref:uncharacterized protein LOC130741153 isoform X2 n=1 Tax=Lotus japonicus TaxID=34305 RepID=UPI0025843D11|nr:uncharacterized protein LOC130741153 isoform X2 [Lotus japonicus]